MYDNVDEHVNMCEVVLYTSYEVCSSTVYMYGGIVRKRRYSSRWARALRTDTHA